MLLQIWSLVSASNRCCHHVVVHSEVKELRLASTSTSTILPVMYDQNWRPCHVRPSTRREQVSAGGCAPSLHLAPLLAFNDATLSPTYRIASFSQARITRDPPAHHSANLPPIGTGIAARRPPPPLVPKAAALARGGQRLAP